PGRSPGSATSEFMLTSSRAPALDGRVRAGRLRERKPDAEGRAGTQSALGGDRAAMVFDDPLEDRKTEARPARLGREEGLEDAGAQLRRDARAGVDDLDAHRGRARELL